jgi:hypothetical protein
MGIKIETFSIAGKTKVEDFHNTIGVSDPHIAIEIPKNYEFIKGIKVTKMPSGKEIAFVSLKKVV